MFKEFFTFLTYGFYYNLNYMKWEISAMSEFAGSAFEK